MARKSGGVGGGCLFLDCDGLSRLIADDRRVVERVHTARRHGMNVATSSLTIVEAIHDRVDKARLNWVLSGIDIKDATERIGREASRLLLAAGLHGHKYAVDAVVAATAMAQPGPVMVVTSDVEDLTVLCDVADRPKRVVIVSA